MNSSLDDIDLKIIQLLQKDAQMPYTEIAKRVFVSSGTVHVRMRKMKELGIVKNATLRVDYTKLGYNLTAFLGVFLDKSSVYDDVLHQLEQIPEIIKLNYTTGNYSMFVEVLCKDTNHLKEILHSKIQIINGISRTETTISLNADIDRGLALI